MNEKAKSTNPIVSALKKSNMTAIGAVLVVMIIIASISSPYFLDIYNLQSVIRDLAFVGMIGVAQSLLLLIGELDLSVGKIASLCGILSGMMMVTYGMNPWLSLAIALLCGLLFGCINGLIITKLRLNSMVATIGMQGLYGGINLVLTKGKAITGIPEEIYFLGKGNVGPIPAPFLFCIGVLIVVLFLVKKTKTGRYIYAIGNSREAARILGINVNRIRVLIYSLVGLISSLAGILYVARLGSSQSAIVAVAESPAKKSSAADGATVSVVSAVSRAITVSTVIVAEDAPSAIVRECGTSRKFANSDAVPE